MATKKTPATARPAAAKRATSKPSTTTAKQQARAGAETAKEGAERAGIAAPSLSEVEKARNKGVTDAIKEQAKDAYEYATDGQLPGEPALPGVTNTGEHTNMLTGMLSLGPDGLEAAIDEKAPSTLSDEQVANLLALERNGPNRTAHVQILCKRLKIKTPVGVPGAGGPGYTRDVTNITDLETE